MLLSIAIGFSFAWTIVCVVGMGYFSVESLRYEGRFLYVVVSISKLGYGFCDTVTTGYNWSYSPWDSCKFFSGSKVWMCVSVLEVCKIQTMIVYYFSML